MLPTALVSLTLLGTTPALRPYRVEAPLTIDGRLDEPAWSQASASDEFTQADPEVGGAPTERTQVQVLYDDRAVYVGVRCEQLHSPINSRLTRRDRDIETDLIRVAIDSLGTGTSAYDFTVTAAGVQIDRIRFDDTSASSTWDGIWASAVHRSRRAWSVELAIPLRILRYRSTPQQSWGFQVERYVAARAEKDQWAFVPPTDAGEVSRYGSLGPFESLEVASPFELRPTAVARWRRQSTDTREGWDAQGALGLDLKWLVSSDLTMDATFFPDFAQVEADEVLLSLSTYETFFTEKRPFFLEGPQVFSTPVQLLYTRRIGAAPDYPALPSGEALVDPLAPAPIYAGARLVGRLGGSLELGALSAITGPNRVEVRTSDGALHDRTTDPLTVFNVLRLKQSIGRTSHLGLLAAATTRLEASGQFPTVDDPDTSERQVLCPQGDLVAPGGGCTHDAYVAAADWRLRSSGEVYSFSGQAMASLVEQGPPRILPDGTVLSSGDAAPGVSLLLAKEGGAHWLWSLGYDGFAPRLDLNDAGYLPRQNLHEVAASLGYRTVAPLGPTRATRSIISVSHQRNWDGLDLGSNVTLTSFAMLPSVWSATANLSYTTSAFDDRLIGNGTGVERASRFAAVVSVASPSSDSVSGSLTLNVASTRNGLDLGGFASVTTNVLPELDLTVSLSAAHLGGDVRPIGRGLGGALAFGRLTYENVSGTVRATLALSPTLTLQAYAQLFVGTFDYDRFTTYPGTGSVHLDDLEPSPPPRNPDFQLGALNASAFLQWEYRLGQVLYLVYTRAQTADDAPAGEAPSLDVGAIGRGPAEDILFLKLVYWWS